MKKANNCKNLYEYIIEKMEKKGWDNIGFAGMTVTDECVQYLEKRGIRAKRDFLGVQFYKESE